LPRRAAMMARPARVRIRSRKPCVLARRRLFGWKVRLLTRGLQECLVSRWRRAWGVAWLSPCAYETLAIRLGCTALRRRQATGWSAPRRPAATAIDNSTLLRYAGLCHRVKPSPAANTSATPAEHAALAHATFIHTPVDNDLNDVGRAYYRCWPLAPSDPTRALPSSGTSQEPRLCGTRRCPLHHPSESIHRARERAPWLT
jgi:hypothetical protein